MLLYLILFVVNLVTIRCSYDELHLPTYFFSITLRKTLRLTCLWPVRPTKSVGGGGDLRMLRGQSRDHLAVLHIRLHCYFYLVCNQKHTVVLKINKHDWTAVFLHAREPIRNVWRKKKKTTLSKLHTERHKWCQTYTRHTQTIWNTISLLAERKCGSLVLVNRAVLGLLYVLSEHKDIFVVFMYSKKAYFKYTLVYISKRWSFFWLFCVRPVLLIFSPWFVFYLKFTLLEIHVAWKL